MEEEEKKTFSSVARGHRRDLTRKPSSVSFLHIYWPPHGELSSEA